MNDSPTTPCSPLRSASSAGRRAPAASAAAPHRAFTSGWFTIEMRSSPRAAISTPAGRWKFSSKVTELRTAPQTASAR